jgi:nucleotide-binding universal stress UspA family protein
MWGKGRGTMFNHILVPLDGSSLAECVLPHTVAIAQAFKAQSTLLRVLERSTTTGRLKSVDPLEWQMVKAELNAYLNGVTARLQEVGIEAENTLLEGQAAERVVQFAQSHDVKLIILSSHGRSGLSGWNVSGVVQKIILRAYIPTMIVRAYRPTLKELTGLRYRRLLVPLDCSQRAESVLPIAATLARHHESQLVLAHIVPKPEMPRRAPPSREDIDLANKLTERNRQEATRYLKQLKSRLSLDARNVLIVSDNVAASLHELVEREEIDLVLLSAHGYSGGAKWPYGSVTISFIAYGTTPLLILQDLPPDEVEPTLAEVASREHKGH